MTFHRRLTLLILAGLLACAAVGSATALAPFIDLQEQGLSAVSDGKGLMTWDHASPVSLNVNVGGTVRFALLYWAGRERPCNFDGTTCTFTQPYKDQQMTFNGNPLTGTVIGTESQPTSAGGPILNIGYFADVTSQVAAAGTGSHSFTFGDGNTASNLWRLDGVSLFVAYTDAANTTFYRLIVWDNLDFAYGDDPTPGDNRVTSPVTFGHGAYSADRSAQLWLIAGDGEATRPDNTTVSNNPTLFNILNSASGEQWNNLLFTINVPANVNNTVVQMNSQPPGQNPDSLLWEVAALRVPLPGGIVEELPPAPPTCPTTVFSGPPAQAVTTFQDTGSGLISIVVNQSDNADTVVPPFIPGTTDPVTVTSTKIDQTHSAHITITATDGAGNVAVCDPIHLLFARGSGQSPKDVLVDVARAENKVTIRNGKPGLVSLDLFINGVKYRVKDLRKGEQRTVDISAFMTQEKNTISLHGRGPRASWAEVIVWDGGGAAAGTR
ncbi:MAG: hypothetical protein QOF89_3871 [Acidobacteriota bacterium]|jgi:hypothetical protein|nr:hypothetical protein [Acidobacteriota bacterium]